MRNISDKLLQRRSKWTFYVQ